MKYSIEVEYPVGTVKTLQRYDNKTDAVNSARRRIMSRGAILRIWHNGKIIWEKKGGNKRASIA